MMKKTTILIVINFCLFYAFAQNQPKEVNDFKHNKKNSYFNFTENNSDIRFDSIVSISTYKEVKEIYSIDGNLVSMVLKDIQSGQPINSSKYSYTYNSQGKRLTELVQNWSQADSTWMNNVLTSYSYDSENNMLSDLLQSWDDNLWNNKYLFTYTYDENGFILTKTSQDWMDDFWLNEFHSEYIVNSSGNILQETRYNWDNNEWYVNVLYSYTFDENGNNLIYLWQFWRNNKWENYKITTYTYDTYGNRLSYMVQNWEENDWVNDFINTYTYNSNDKRLTLLQENWYENDWQDVHLYTYNYNNDGMPESIVMQTWIYTHWVSQVLFSYDEYGHLKNTIKQYKEGEIWINDEQVKYDNSMGHINAIAFEWNEDTWEENNNGINIDIYDNGEIILQRIAGTVDLYYTNITGIKEESFSLLDSKIYCYPNPVTNNEINLKIDETLYDKNIIVELRSTTGQTVKSFKLNCNSFQQQIKINVNDVSSGIYLLQLKTSSSSYSQKIIINK